MSADDAKIATAVNFLLDPAMMGVPGPKLTPYLKGKLGLTDAQVKEAMKKASEAPKPRQDKIATAVEFLENESVRDKELGMKVAYMKKKLEMTDPEVHAALSQAAAPPPSEPIDQAVEFLNSGALRCSVAAPLRAAREFCAERPPPPLRAEGVKASDDNVAKAKYLLGAPSPRPRLLSPPLAANRRCLCADKTKMKEEDVAAAFEKCGMKMPELPKEEPAPAPAPADEAKAAQTERAEKLKEAQ